MSVSWLERIRRTLQRPHRNGVLLLVYRAFDFRLRELVLALLPEHPEIEVHAGIERLDQAPHGATVILALRPEESTWLNINRPYFTRRALKVILWASEETTIHVNSSAPDFSDWVSHYIECPSGAPPHGVANLRAALPYPRIAWLGGSFEDCLQEAFPGAEVVPCVARTTYAEMLRQVKEAGQRWLLWSGVEAQPQVELIRCAIAEAHHIGTTALLKPRVYPTGWWPAHGREAKLPDAIKRLAQAGAAKPGRLAALTGLEPEALQLAVWLLHDQVSQNDLEKTLRESVDAGASLARHSRALRSDSLQLPGSVEEFSRSVREFRGQRHPSFDQEEEESHEELLQESPLQLRALSEEYPLRDVWLNALPHLLSPEERGRLIYQTGKYFLKQNQYKLSLSLFREAALYPGQETSHLFTELPGSILSLLEENEGIRHPATAEGFFLMGEAAVAQGRYEGAIDFYQEAVSRTSAPSGDPGLLLKYLTALGRAQSLASHTEGASAAFQRALSLLPPDTIASARIQMEQGLALVRARKPGGSALVKSALGVLEAEPGAEHPEVREAKRELQALQESLSRAITASTLRLRMHSPFFGTLSLFAEVEPNESAKIAQTDGQTIFIHPDQILSLAPMQLDALLVHYLLHAALLHPSQQEEQKTARGLLDTELFVNGVIFQQSFLELPQSLTMPADLQNQPAEELEGKIPSCFAPLAGSKEELAVFWKKAFSQSALEHFRLRPQDEFPFMLLAAAGFPLDREVLASKGALAYEVSKEELPDLEAIRKGRGKHIAFPQDPLVCYATAIRLASDFENIDDAIQAFLWMSAHARAEWVQLFVSNLIVRARSRGMVGPLGLAVQRTPELQRFIKNYQSLLGYDNQQG